MAHSRANPPKAKLMSTDESSKMSVFPWLWELEGAFGEVFVVGDK